MCSLLACKFSPLLFIIIIICRSESLTGRAPNAIGAASLRPSLLSSSSASNINNSTITVVSGRSVSLRCPVIAYPIESLLWQHNGNTLPVNHRQKVDQVINGGKLHISNVHRSADQGEYWCVVKGSNGKSVKGSVHLIAKVAPLIDSQLLSEKTFANQGMKVKLMCSILEGDPPIEIKWYRGDAQQPVVSSHTISLQNGEDYSLLTFKSVSRHDMGNWTCKAWNEVELVNRSTYLIVNVAPSWRIEPKNVFVVLGTSCVIDCAAEGSPTPRMVWKKSISSSGSSGSSGGGISSSAGDASLQLEHPSEFRDILSSYRHQVYGNGTFILQEVDKSDTGFYMCQISNGIGAGLSKVIQLIVQSPPYFETKFISKSAIKGETAILQCEAHGDPVMLVEWQKDKQKINSMSDKRYSFKQEIVSPQKIISYLEISAATRHDSALYTCLVTNDFGSDDTNIQLIIQEVPEPPHGLSAQDVTSRTATLTWKSSFSGNSAITKYVAHYRQNCTDNHSWQDTPTLSGNELRLELRNLLPTCTYSAKMFAENALGRSELSSSVVYFTTAEEVPGGPPRDVIVEATSSTSLKIKWKPPKRELQYGKIKGYYVGYKTADFDEPYQYKNVEASGDFANSNNYDESKFEVSYVTNLKRKTTYVIILQAYNSIGAGPRSDEVRVITYDSQPPTSPLLEVLVTSTNSITLRWDENQNDIEEKEFILHFKEEREQEWHSKRLKTKLNQYTLNSSNGLVDIRCGTKYMLYMTATNSLGSGEPSKTITTRTKGAAPVSPSNLEFISPNATTATLRLNSWQNGGCSINYFAIKYKPTYQKQWILLSDRVNYEKEYFYLSNLAPNREYKLLVSAHSDAGVTEAEYHFKTLNLSLVVRVLTPQMPVDVSSQAESLSLFRNVTVLLPVVISVVVLCVVLATLFGCMRRQHVAHVVNGNSDIGNSCSHKSDLRQSSESFPLNDFQCGSKPKYIDCGQTPPNKTFGNNCGSYYASPHRKSLTTMIGGGQQRSEHEYAEPCAQQLSKRCMFSEELVGNCGGNMASSLIPASVQLPDKMYATIKRSPPLAYT